MASERASTQTFFSVSTLLFIASVAVTIIWGISMSAMDGMPMPGGWTMSMTWMTGTNWFGPAVSFLGMWIVMMIAMMMPSLVPMLWRYRQAAEATSNTRLGWLTVLAGVGYFFVWTIFGIAIFPIGVVLATAEMQLPPLSHAVPLAIGLIFVVAGGLQFTKWKARHLACCRVSPGCGHGLPATSATAWRQGVRFGLDCAQCCFGLMIILLVVGVMDLRAMAVVAVAITIERLLPAGERIARITGVVAIAAGLFLIGRAVGFG